MFGVPSIIDQIRTRKINFYRNSVNQTMTIARAFCLPEMHPESERQFVDD